MSTYAKADTKAQWYQDDHPGSDLHLGPATMVLVVHTTEGTDWPGYSGGAVAPNDTAKPIMRERRLAWRAHFPDEKSSRALVNASGGVQTNTSNAVQVELVGTCDPTHRHTWGKLRAGVDYIFWPDAPDWALRELAEFVADMHRRHGLPLVTLPFRAYPASYGKGNGVRLSFAQWRSFAGVCGHQHVPENVHGDPGDLPMLRVLDMAREMVAPVAKPTRQGPSRVTKFLEGGPVYDMTLLRAAAQHGREDAAHALARIDAAVANMPKGLPVVSRVARFRKSYRAGTLRLGLLRSAVNEGRTGAVKTGLAEIQAAIAELRP